MTTTNAIRHAGMQGIRVCVRKPQPQLGWTTIYVPARRLSKLLDMTGGSVRAVTRACRCAALSSKSEQDRTWSDVVLDGAVRVIEKARHLEEAVMLAVAAENNAQWADA